MPTTYGPQSLPYPLPSDAPDVPGAILSLLQVMQVGGALPFSTYALLTASGNGFQGQLASVNADTTAALNGIYMSNGSGWQLIGGRRNLVSPSMGSGYSAGLGQITQRGTLVTFNFQFIKSTSIAAGDTVFTLPANSRPPSTQLLLGATTTGGQGGAMTFLVSTAGVVTVNSTQATGSLVGWVVGSFENA